MAKLVKESEYFIVWFLFWLSSVIGGFVVGAVAGFVLGLILGMSGVDIQTIKIVCAISGFIIGVPLSYFLFRIFVGQMIVKKVEARISSMEIQQGE